MTEAVTDGTQDATAAAVVPLAATLDEVTLRRVFPDAPRELSVPSGAGALFRARMRTLGGSWRLPLMLVGGSLLLLAVLVLFVGNGGAAAVIAAIVLGPLLVVGVLEHGKAQDEFFGRYARARGLRHAEGGHLDARVPLLRRGDEREISRVLTGTIAGRDATLALYTYTEVSQDSEGNRQETDHDYTLLHFRLPESVAQRFVGVYCAPRGVSFGALQDKLAHDRAVELESVEFRNRYSLRVVDAQDDVALYELFSPPFVQRLAAEVNVHWEQCGRDLVAWRRGHECDAADLDRFCLEAWHVLHRYLEEHR